jgi:hypothetical protein
MLTLTSSTTNHNSSCGSKTKGWENNCTSSGELLNIRTEQNWTCSSLWINMFKVAISGPWLQLEARMRIQVLYTKGRIWISWLTECWGNTWNYNQRWSSSYWNLLSVNSSISHDFHTYARTNPERSQSITLTTKQTTSKQEALHTQPSRTATLKKSPGRITYKFIIIWYPTPLYMETGWTNAYNKYLEGRCMYRSEGMYPITIGMIPLIFGPGDGH